MKKEMKEYIELGEEKAGKQIELAKMLGISDGYVRLIKTGKKGLPVPLCIKLANYINEDQLEVIAASNLVTEKDEERRKILESCFKKTNRAASFLIAALLFSVISIMTPNPANAQPATTSIDTQFVLCKIHKIIKYVCRLFASISNSVGNFFQRAGFAG